MKLPRLQITALKQNPIPHHNVDVLEASGDRAALNETIGSLCASSAYQSTEPHSFQRRPLPAAPDGRGQDPNDGRQRAR